VVCADLTEIEDEEIVSIAKQVMEKQVRDIADAIHEIAQRHNLNTIVACGLGEFIVKEAADKLGFEVILISEKYGKEISKVFPAYAVAQLVKYKLMLS